MAIKQRGEEAMKVSVDSFLLYWSKIRELPIPQPSTDIVYLTEKDFEMSFEGVPKKLEQYIADHIKGHFNLPVFLRTDLSSAKHDWKNTCYYDGSQPLYQHLFEIFQFNHCADVMGLPFRAIIIREYIPMASEFTAFYGQMPVNPERRYFIKDAKILCHHPYWIEEAIESCHVKPSVENWKEIAKRLNTETDDEVTLLSNYATRVARVVDGFWSVDFCKAQDGRWILIDMATGERSWHPKECQYSNLSPTIDYLEMLKSGP